MRKDRRRTLTFLLDPPFTVALTTTTSHGARTAKSEAERAASWYVYQYHDLR